MTDANRQIHVGVDGGGTHCRVRLQDARGIVLAEATGGAANVRLGQDVAWSNISAAIDAALQGGGLPHDVLTGAAAGFGLAGVLKPEDCGEILGQSHRFASLKITSDAHVACLGAFDGKDGAIQIVGTGSASYAIVGGTGQPLGGWGFALAERASGAALGRDAVLAALQAHDGFAAQSPLTRAIIAHFGTPLDIVDWSEKAAPRDFAALAPMVFSFVEEGDAIALVLARRLAADCAVYIEGLIRLGVPGVCLLGGLASSVEPLLPPDVATHLVAPRGDALHGALLLARQGQTEARERVGS